MESKTVELIDKPVIKTSEDYDDWNVNGIVIFENIQNIIKEIQIRWNQFSRRAYGVNDDGGFYVATGCSSGPAYREDWKSSLVNFTNLIKDPELRNKVLKDLGFVN